MNFNKADLQEAFQAGSFIDNSKEIKNEFEIWFNYYNNLISGEEK